MRLLHIADVHLDTPFASRAETLRRRLRAASREALRNAFDLALTEELDAVLIAGDLFDGERLSFETESFLVEQLLRLDEAGVAVIYATGNHDPGRAGVRAVARPWPGNVTVVGSREPKRVAVRDARGAAVGWVTAAGHESSRETMDLARAFPRPASDLPEVALLHTQVHDALDAGEHHAYAPSERSFLERAGFHYWALGHVHRRQRLSARPPVHYAGSLQGRTPAETGPHGGLLVDLSDTSEPRVTFRPLAPVRWETIRADRLVDVTTFEGLVRRVGDAWRADRARDDRTVADGWIVRVILDGPSPLWRELGRHDDRRHLAGELTDALGALHVELRADGVHPPVDVEAQRRRRDVLGEALRLLDEVRAGETLLEGAGPGDLAAAETDRELDVATWVAERLEGAAPDLVSRVLEPESLDAAVAEHTARKGG